MARIRTIKPEFFDDEDIAAMSFPARLVFIGLWQQADREGRLKDRPVRLKARILPFDDVSMDELLNEIARHGFIRRYVVGDLALIQIRTFEKHQQVGQREQASSLPPPDDEKHVLSPADASEFLSGREGKGKEGNGNGVQIALRARFEEFWAVYPRKEGKDAAWREWLKRSPSDDLTRVMIGKVHEQRASAQWLKDGGQYIPHPRTWLHQARWEDERMDVPNISPRTARMLGAG